MMPEKLLCTARECKKRLTQSKNMSLEALERYNTECSSCGNWIIKESEVANKTYHVVSNKWAVKFMEQFLK